MKKELSNLEIVKNFNRGKSIKEIAEEMGYTESTIRKRINKEYFYSESLKKYVGKDKKEEFEKLQQIAMGCNCGEEIAILTMERYENEEYWVENEFEVWDESFFSEDISMIEFLYDELEKDAEKLSVSVSEITVLYLLRYLTYFKSRKGSGLKFERNYKKSFNERDKHDGQVLLKDNEYEIRELDREIERLKDEGQDNEEIEFIVRYGADEEEETYILHEAYLRKKGFTEEEIERCSDDILGYYYLVKNRGMTDIEKMKVELKRLASERSAERERQFNKEEFEKKKKYIKKLSKNGYTREQIQSLNEYELRSHYYECGNGKTFDEVVEILAKEREKRKSNVSPFSELFETEEEGRERRLKRLKDNGYTDEQIESLNDRELTEHYLFGRDKSFDEVVQILKLKEIEETGKLKELYKAAEIIINRKQGDKSWIEDFKNEIRLKIQKEIEEGKDRKVYTGCVAIH